MFVFCGVGLESSLHFVSCFLTELNPLQAQLTHIEQTTSTTSLMAQEIVAHSMALLRDDIIMRRMSPTDLLATAANIRACQSEISSVSSDRLEM